MSADDPSPLALKLAQRIAEQGSIGIADYMAAALSGEAYMRAKAVKEREWRAEDAAAAAKAKRREEERLVREYENMMAAKARRKEEEKKAFEEMVARENAAREKAIAARLDELAAEARMGSLAPEE